MMNMSPKVFKSSDTNESIVPPTYFVQTLFGKQHHDIPIQYIISFIIVRQEYGNQRRRQIIDTLNIGRRWVPHGPNVEQPTQDSFDSFVPKEGNLGCGPRNVHQDLPKSFLLLQGTSIVINVVVLRNGILVFGSFPF